MVKSKMRVPHCVPALMELTALKPLRWFEQLWGVAAWGEPGGESGVALRSVGLPYQRHVQ